MNLFVEGFRVEEENMCGIIYVDIVLADDMQVAKIKNIGEW